MKPREAFPLVFMGTPAFAVGTLEKLLQAGYPVRAVVTAPDKPAGRGLKTRIPAVKACALEHQLRVLQPVSLKDPDFNNELAQIEAALYVVVAFRMLPEAVWKLPEHGTINLHASLLPQYRGAAPINWAIIKGERKTGVSTFFIDHEIDTGRILFQEEVAIGQEENAGQLHDKLLEVGSSLVLRTVDAIREGNYSLTDQRSLFPDASILKRAPKINKEDCRINWFRPSSEVVNLIRGLSPYPAAHTTLAAPDGSEYNMKIFDAVASDYPHEAEPGDLSIVNDSYLLVRTLDGWVQIKELQLSGKSRVGAKAFLNGFRIAPGWKMK